MKICVSYSESHKAFLEDFFLKTFPFEEGVSLLIEKLSQKCSSGELFSQGWRDQMIEKEIFINRELSAAKQGELLLFTDVDVSFYGPFKKDLVSHLKNKDICFMKDHNSDELGRCGGFFVVRSTKKMKAFFNNVLEKLKTHTDNAVEWSTSEQSTINTLLNENKDIKWGYLPPRYYTHGLYTDGIENFSSENQSGLWWENKSRAEKSGIFVPKDILVHHANWAHGIGNKLDVLRWVKDIHAWNSRPVRKGG